MEQESLEGSSHPAVVSDLCRPQLCSTIQPLQSQKLSGSGTLVDSRLLKKKKKKNVWGAWLAQSEERATLDLRVHPAEWWLSPIPRLPGSCFSFSIAAIPSLGRWPVNLGSAACGSQGLESGPVDASSPFPAIALKGVYLVTCYLGVSKHRTEFREYNADFYTPVV
eukprot:XP_022260387.1 uncharacterized protein LOC102152163 isoform X1 [Canis lupus familiaris]